MIYDGHEALSGSMIEIKENFIRKPGLNIRIKVLDLMQERVFWVFFKYVFVDVISRQGIQYKVQMTFLKSRSLAILRHSFHFLVLS